jgi:hypothetical protein
MYALHEHHGKVPYLENIPAGYYFIDAQCVYALYEHSEKIPYL